MGFFNLQRLGRTLLLSAVMVVGAVCVSYGDGGNPSELVGHWIHYEGAEYGTSDGVLPAEIELFSDGTGVVRTEMFGRVSGGSSITWKAENKRLRLLSTSNATVADYKVSGYELILVYDERQSARFIKKENFGEYKKKREEEKKRKEEVAAEAAKKKKEEEKKEEERIKKEAERVKKETGLKRKEAEQRFEKVSSYFTDSRNSQKYRTAKIGGKTWMAQNLNYQTGKSWCYGNDNSNCEIYGRLYDWNTAKTACPTGWHLPLRQEWDNLGQSVGGKRTPDEDGNIDWYDAGKALKSTYGYVDGGNGTDTYGFSALPGGNRDVDGEFDGVSQVGTWWTATEKYGSGGAYARTMFYDEDHVSEVLYAKGLGYSVRCVEEAKRESELSAKEAEVAKEETMVEQRIEKISAYFTDSRDGQKYRSVKIGGKTWMAQNMNYPTGQSWCYDGDNSNCGKYGRLYDWNTVKKVCPTGWHLPSRKEWMDLTAAAGGDKALKSTYGWSSNGNGTDDYGFSALPGGRYNYNFSFGGSMGLWWTASKTVWSIVYDNKAVADNLPSDKNGGYSVRCIAD